VLYAGVFIHRQAWHVRAIRFLLVAAGAYIALMFLTGTLQDPPPAILTAARYWLPAWPILAAIVLGTLARVDLRRWVRAVLAIALLVPASVTAGQFSRSFSGKLPGAKLESEYLEESWRESLPVRFILNRRPSCTIVSNNPPLLIIHGDFGLVHRLPTSIDAIFPLVGLLTSRSPVCIIYFTKMKAPSVRGYREFHRAVLERLERAELIELVGRDEISELWMSRGEQPPPGDPTHE
jgi:hypothetical protein